MAIEGAYNAQQFSAGRPDALSWQQHMMYWDTQNPFSAGTRGVRSTGTNPFQQTRSGVQKIATEIPIGQAPRAQARPVNMLGNPRNLSFGGRNYGTQQIDRGEIDRIGSFIRPAVSAMTQSREQGEGQRAPRSRTTPPSGVPAPPSTPAGRLAQRWRQRNAPQPPQSLNMGLPQNVPLPPQPGEAPPLPSPTQPAPGPSWVTTPPTGPTKHPLATSNWREEQAQRVAEYELGEPGQPTPDVGIGSRTYQQERAQERQARDTAPSEPEAGMPTSAERRSRARQLQAERELARGNAPRNRNLPSSVASGRTAPTPQNVPFEQPAPTPRPGSVGTVPITMPTSPVGGQEERLAAEGAAPATPAKRTRNKND